MTPINAIASDGACGTVRRSAIVNSSLLRSRRQQLHARVAATLEVRFPEIVVAQPALLAPQLARCVRRGGGRKNVAWSKCCDTRRRRGEQTGNTNIDRNWRPSLAPYSAAHRGDAWCVPKKFARTISLISCQVLRAIRGCPPRQRPRDRYFQIKAIPWRRQRRTVSG